MDKSVEKKYIILFAILIALTGFTFESQTGNNSNAESSSSLQTEKFSRLP